MTSMGHVGQKHSLGVKVSLVVNKISQPSVGRGKWGTLYSRTNLQAELHVVCFGFAFLLHSTGPTWAGPDGACPRSGSNARGEMLSLGTDCLYRIYAMYFLHRSSLFLGGRGQLCLHPSLLLTTNTSLRKGPRFLASPTRIGRGHALCSITYLESIKLSWALVRGVNHEGSISKLRFIMYLCLQFELLLIIEELIFFPRVPVLMPNIQCGIWKISTGPRSSISFPDTLSL